MSDHVHALFDIMKMKSRNTLWLKSINECNMESIYEIISLNGISFPMHKALNIKNKTLYNIEINV